MKLNYEIMFAPLSVRIRYYQQLEQQATALRQCYFKWKGDSLSTEEYLELGFDALLTRRDVLLDYMKQIKETFTWTFNNEGFNYDEILIRYDVNS